MVLKKLSSSVVSCKAYDYSEYLIYYCTVLFNFIKMNNKKYVAYKNKAYKNKAYKKK